MSKAKIWLALALAASTGVAFQASAKGLNELAPEKAEAATPPAASETTTEPAPATAAPAATEAPPATEPPAGGEDAVEPKKEGEELPAAPLEPSEMSKNLADKLYLATGMGLVQTSGGPGNWSSWGMADILAAYLVNLTVVPNAVSWATIRYAPMHANVETKSKAKAYRAVAEAYHFGLLQRYPWRDKITLVGSGELGIVVVSAQEVLDKKVDSEVEKSGVNLTAGGGADWKILEKLTVGPRLYIGLGRLTTIQLSGTASFIF